MISVEKENLESFNQQSKENEIYARIDRHNTNHVLHLLLSIVTLGLWSWVWIIVASGNCDKRNIILKQYNKETETNIATTLFIVYITVNVTVAYYIISS